MKTYLQHIEVLFGNILGTAIFEQVNEMESIAFDTLKDVNEQDGTK